MNLLKAFETNAVKYPDKDFIRYNKKKYSYKEMQKFSNQAANLFRSKGLKSGDKIAIMCYNTPSFIIGLLGAWKIGAAVVPINHKIKGDILSYILENSESRLLLFDASLSDVIRKLSLDILLFSTEGEIEKVLNFDKLIQGENQFSEIIIDDDGIAEILYTSGTTGKPKGCVMLHKNIAFAAMIAAIGLSVVPEEVCLMAMPIWHSSPLNNWFGSTLYVGGTIVLMREYNPVELLKVIQEEKITLYFGAPISYILPMRIVKDFENYDLSTVRAWIYGGGAISPTLCRELIKAYKSPNFYQVFGMTEVGPLGMCLRPHEQLQKAGSIGKTALPGVEMKLLNNLGELAKKGEIAEIYYRTMSTMQSYLGLIKETEEVLSKDQWYKTGDLVKIDEDGYLFFVDRVDDVIVSGGENIYSKEVEDALEKHSDVSESAVIGIPNEEWGQTVVAYIVLKPNSLPEEEDLKIFLTDKIAAYTIPRHFYFVKDLPRTPSGKIEKYVLRSHVQR